MFCELVWSVGVNPKGKTLHFGAPSVGYDSASYKIIITIIIKKIAAAKKKT